MSREILFRAKCFGNWRYGSYVHFVKKPTNIRCNINYKDFIVTNEEDGEHYYPITDLSSIGQYTGLKDKKRRRIFEGDIVGNNGFVHLIKYVGIFAGFFTVSRELRGSFGYFDQKWIDYCDIVVVGNVTDSPELLK